MSVETNIRELIREHIATAESVHVRELSEGRREYLDRRAAELLNRAAS